ncbi:MAG: hypothetical protein ACJAR2_002307 [Ilumatobacter sp.]|jgi:hypothetical protein
MCFAVDVHQSEQIAAHTAQVWARDRNHCVGGDRCIHGVTASGKHLDARRRGQVVR